MKTRISIFLTLIGFLFACTTSKQPICSSNTDCQGLGEGYYCQVRTLNCHTIAQGSCQRISKLIKNSKVSYNKKHLTLSNQGMNWFSANNWCKAQGMELVQLSDFNISEPKNICYFSSQKDKNNYCDLPKEAEKQLRGIFGNEYYYWTQNSNDSCTAFGMCFINNYVRPLNKDATLRHAVCIN